MNSANFSHCRRPIYNQCNGGDDIAVTLSGASGARRAPCNLLCAGVSGTDPGRVLSWKLDVFSTYDPSPDTSLYVPATSSVTPALPEGPVQPLDTEFLSSGGPVSMDSLFVRTCCCYRSRCCLCQITLDSLTDTALG